MNRPIRLVLYAVGGIALLGATGCATNQDLESLRTELKAEIASVQETADQAMMRANTAYILAQQANDSAAAAMSEAQAARAAAAAADAKAERIYTESLRK
jgi:hypothetical protein